MLDTGQHVCSGVVCVLGLKLFHGIIWIRSYYINTAHIKATVSPPQCFISIHKIKCSHLRLHSRVQTCLREQ